MEGDNKDWKIMKFVSFIYYHLCCRLFYRKYLNGDIKEVFWRRQ
jgi:hypothetical protein